ncbi:MAG TPA: hypothetical protein VGQ97_06700, partial [Xanthobacteraceae bacterium]|nr:hypothetical protein [Xanthobacteraceae bacterium]
FRLSAETFRRVPIEEAKGVTPLRIAVATVARGDTVERLAARMPGDRQLERFLVLNGLERGAAVKPGDRVKVIVE